MSNTNGDKNSKIDVISKYLQYLHKVWLPAALKDGPTSLSSLDRALLGKLNESCVVSDCAVGLKSPAPMGFASHGVGADDDSLVSKNIF